jgi:ACS family hexuronate transporter-like MFS transporter
MMRRSIPWRWIAIGIFVFSSALNYLDRQILATVATIWRVHPEFPFNYADYGELIERFSIAYALAAPLMGLFLDWVGLNAGICVSVFLWSAISILTGNVHGFGQLLWYRTALGVAEASGISAFGKATGAYLLPKERAVGAAMSQVGLSVGLAAAPLLATRVPWRTAFYLAGVFGLLWIPIWLFTASRIKPIAPGAEAGPRGMTQWEIVRDQRFWAMALANGLSMTFYTLWTNWTPAYLQRVHHLTPAEAANYAWVVPLAGYCGAFLGGWVSWRLISGGMTPVSARMRVCLVAAIVVFFSIGIPLLPTPLLATIGMSLSFFSIAAWSTNLYTLPVDIYGAGRAAFGVSGLVFAYGAMQALVSRRVGQVIEQHGFAPVILTFAMLPLLAYLLLRLFIHRPEPRSQAALAEVL